MGLNEDMIAARLAGLLSQFISTMNAIAPIPIDLGGLAELTPDTAMVSEKLHQFIADQPLHEHAANIAHGFVDAWVGAMIVSLEVTEGRNPDLRRAAERSFQWAVGFMGGSIAYLEHRFGSGA